MGRQRSQTRARTRTISLAQTPPARITWFPKRERAPAAALQETKTYRIEELVTDPGPEAAALERDTLGYHRRKLEKLLRGDRRALEGLDSSGLGEIAVLGHQLYEDGRLNEARVVFEGLVAMDPPEAFPYTVLGAIYLAQQDLHRALALFEAALELDPTDVAARVYRGEIRLRLGQRAKGMRDLERALATDPDGPRSPFSQRARSALDQARRYG